jgi:prepilin-type N-terminal cleavage/methylation domain-containing protein
MIKLFYNNRGFGLVEVVVAISIISVSLMALAVAGQISSRVVTDSLFKTQALFLAEEGIEVVRAMRDESWSQNIAPLNFDAGIGYYLIPTTVLGSISWSVTTTDPGPIDDVFQRELYFSEVHRDGVTDDIATSSGLLDNNTIKVRSSVHKVRKTKLQANHFGTVKGVLDGLTGSAGHLDIVGDFAYVTSRSGDFLKILDISDTANFEDVGTITHGVGATALDGAKDVFVLNNLAYVTSSSFSNRSLSVFDIADPENITEEGTIVHGVGATALLGAQGLYVDGDYAYVASQQSDSLSIFKISDLENITEEGKIVHGAGATALDGARGVYIDGAFAYVVSQQSDSLSIFDITDPVNIEEKDIIINGAGATALDVPKDIIVKDGYAYVISGSFVNGSLSVFDIADPDDITEEGTIVHGDGATALADPQGIDIVGNYAYISSKFSQAISILDISDPTDPKEVNVIQKGQQTNYLGWPRELKVVGDFVYVLDQASGSLSAHYLTEGGNAYAFKNEIDFALNKIGHIEDGIGASSLYGGERIKISGNYAYMLGFYDDSLTSIDISDPSNPTEVDVITNGVGATELEGPRSLFVLGEHAFVVSEVNDSLSMFDISDPTDLKETDTIVNGLGATALKDPRDIYVKGNYAYVASYGDGSLSIFNISDPTDIDEVGTITHGVGATALSGAHGVYVDGSYAYVTGYISDSLSIFDITDPISIEEKDVIINGAGATMLNGPRYLTVSGGYAYVPSSDSDSLSIFDISDPEYIQEVGTIKDGDGATALNTAWSVEVRGNYAYVGTYSSDGPLSVIDVSDKNNLVEVSNISGGAGRHLAISGNNAYVGSWSPGALTIFSIDFENLILAELETYITNLFSN